MLLLIDNYDSFTYNLFHYLGELGAEVVVKRNDELTAAQALALKPEAIVLSPGPCDPDRAGICLDLIAAGAAAVPILGVCLGHQAIGQAYGGRVVRAPAPMHGKLSRIHHTGKSVFRGLNNDFEATRYHSLTIAPEFRAGRSGGDGHLRRRRHHGRDAQTSSRSRRAIPSRKHRVGKRSRALAELPQHRGRACARSRMNPADDFGALLKRLAGGETLDADAAAEAFATLISGEVSPARMAAFLTALAMREATVDEIAGAARAMRAAMRKVVAPAGAIDLCGTGGDGHGTLNVSTAAAFVVAACGVPVAKHGNRNMSSRTGTADVLEALGVRIDLEPQAAERCLREAGLCFLFAQTYHPAMKHVAAVRKELGFRTIFNLLGPISNPAGVRRQLLGVFSRDWIEPLAQVLARLGTETAWIVHGSDGLDEMTTTGTTHVAVLERGKVTRREVAPEDAGLTRAPLAALKGGEPAENAAALRALLDGAHGPYRDIVLLNAAAALIVAGKTAELKDGVARARDAIDSGRAKTALARLVASSQEANP